MTNISFLNFISKYIQYDLNTIFFLDTVKVSEIEKINKEFLKSIISPHKVNDIRHINKFFEAINSKIPVGGYFIGTAELNETRNIKILNKYPTSIAYLIIVFNFFFLRVSPKLSLTKNAYFYITKGKGRALSKAEILGRLICCGFEIIEYRIIDGIFVFVTKKVGNPSFDMNPSYSALYKMKRIGKYGKTIEVYKFRTMHAYSEYLQDYLVKTHGYNSKGKIQNDFRATKYGRFLRKYWLDELPQLINVLKGEMKLVGVRPLSKTRFNEFPKDMQTKRIKYKPGCFPPYVALLMPDNMGNIEAERIYIRDKEINPYTTDIKYFLKSIFNILTAKIRSA